MDEETIEVRQYWGKKPFKPYIYTDDEGVQFETLVLKEGVIGVNTNGEEIYTAIWVPKAI